MNNKFYSVFFGCFDDGCGCHTHSYGCGGGTKTVYVNTYGHYRSHRCNGRNGSRRPCGCSRCNGRDRSCGPDRRYRSNRPRGYGGNRSYGPDRRNRICSIRESSCGRLFLTAKNKRPHK